MLRQKNRAETGAAAVEFAIILPLLFGLLLGIVEFGYIFYAQGVASGAARESAREFAIHKVKADAIDAAVGAGGSLITAGMVDIPDTCSGATPGDVTVTITIKDAAITGFFGQWDVSGKGTMRCNG